MNRIESGKGVASIGLRLNQLYIPNFKQSHVKNIFFGLIILIPAAIMNTACQEKTPYQAMVASELSRNERVDSLFLGIKLGMTRKEFYDHCWQLNKQQLVMQAPNNQAVHYDLPAELNSPAYLRFYPLFHEDKIYEMPVSFTYSGWAPWNKALWSDSLLTDVKSLYEKWYGDGFMTVHDQSGKKIYIKVDGNRQISLYKLDDQVVQAVFTDLTVDTKK